MHLQHLGVDKVPGQDGFSLSADPSLPAAASLNWSSAVAPHSSVLLPITWRPTAAGSVSRLIVFKLDGKHRLQVKLLGKAVVQFNQPAGRQTDQSSRPRGTDAAGRKVISSGSPGAQTKQVAPAPAAAAQARASQQPAPAAAPGPAAASASGSSTARSSTVGPPARFKAPTRSSAAGSLKLKPQASQAQAAAAAGTKAAAAIKAPAATGAAHPQSAGVRSSPWQEAAGFAGGMVVPATPRGSRIGAHPPASTPVTAAGKIGRGTGLSSSLTSSSQKAPSSARKTFRFFHTE